MPALFLVSTPVRIHFAFASDLLSIDHIASNLGDFGALSHKGPFERHFYTVEVSTSGDGYKRRFDLDIDDVLGVLSVWFGKSIRNHGLMRLEDFLTLPETLGLQPNAYFELPVYSGDHTLAPRQEPDWRSIAPLLRVFRQIGPKRTSLPLIAASRCYSESLTLLPLDREIAFVRLIQALECVASKSGFSEEELYSHDDRLYTFLQWLPTLSDSRGKECAAFLKERLYQISRSVYLWSKARIGPEFYAGGAFSVDEDNFRSCITSAYALRSGYVHSGLRFGAFIDPKEGRCENFELVPEGFLDACPEKALRKTLSKAPSFLGLERIVRYCLVKEVQSEIAKGDG
jgi:hypothetical protein